MLGMDLKLRDIVADVMILADWGLCACDFDALKDILKAGRYPLYILQ